MATHSITTPMYGRIPANAVSTTRVFPIDLRAADPLPGILSRQHHFKAAEQAAAMNAMLVALNALLVEGGAAQAAA